MTIEHVIEPVAKGCMLTERAHLDGFLAPLVARLLGRRLEAIYAETTAHAASLADL